jgi:hypothetical protein
LKATTNSFLPHATYGLVTDEVLYKFAQGKTYAFLAGTKLLSKFESASRFREAEEVVHRLNIFRGIFGFDKSDKRETKKRSALLNSSLVWDTGASFGLTPFRADFIDYVERSIPVNNFL